MNRFKKTLAGVASLAVVAAVAPFAGVGMASAATNNGQVTLNPTTGISSTPFSLTFPSAPQCNGDTAGAGYNWSTFLVPQGTVIDNLTFTPSGPNVGISLISTNSATVAMQATNIAAGPGQPGLISGIPQFTFNDFGPTDLALGVYEVGVACTTAGGSVVDTYWSRPMTFTANPSGGPAQFTWTMGVVLPPAAPSAPQNVVVTPGDGSLSVAFSAPATGSPATYTYTASATPVGGGTAVTATGASGPLSISGLTNGTAYNVTVTAANTEGTGPASAPVVGTPVQAALDGPNVVATPDIESLDVSWTAPTNGPVPTGYSVTASPGGFSATVTGLSTTIPGLTAGTPYTVTVTPLYSDATIATPGTATATPLSSGVLIQNIVATRPAGALVLTQNCLTDPTCTVNLTTGSLDASGTYYTATGTLYELTVADSRDADAGWTVVGNLAETFATTGDSFDSRAMGWTPEITYNAPAAPDGYDPSPLAGATIAPNTSEAIKAGTAVLFSAPAGSGLGIARATADIDLQIPVSAIAGVYSAQLAISVS